MGNHEGHEGHEGKNKFLVWVKVGLGLDGKYEFLVSIFVCFVVFVVEKDHTTIRLIPFLRRRVLKLMRRPVLIWDSLR
jgi:hypothetical protein